MLDADGREVDRQESTQGLNRFRGRRPSGSARSHLRRVEEPLDSSEWRLSPPLLPLGRGIAWRHAIWQKSKRPSTLNNVEGATVQFRVQFLDVSAAVIKEMLIDTHSEHIGKAKSR
jgi:hypothetical protein